MPCRFLISGGGTGGHIFPAIAIANQLKAMHPDAELLFVGAVGKMEMEKVPQAGYKIISLNITGIQRSLSLSNVLFPFKLVQSLFKARSIIRSFKPDVVIGVGGFASGPVLRMATWMKVPSLIQEQNSFAGITNRWVAGSVQKACVAYEGMDRFFPKEVIVNTGNPVRKEVVAIDGKREQALKHFNLSPEQPVVLAVGGSLGARSINRALHAHIDMLLDQGVQLIWQTGKHFKEEVAVLQAKYADRAVRIHEFIYEMDLAYAAADMVVSRAGALAVSELCIVGKPVILVPFPFAAEDHQTKNAEALVKTNAAIMVRDAKAMDELVGELLRLMADKDQMALLAKNVQEHAKPKATESIAEEVLRLARR